MLSPSIPIGNGSDQVVASDQTFQGIVPEKIHIRGVDDLTTEDVIAFVAEHFQLETPARIEWIDDTSANIVFSTSTITSDALHHLSLDPLSPDDSSISQLRAARIFSKHPELRLEVRMAFPTDHKKPRAHEASRFYMMHPEHDPREKRRHEPSSRSHEYKRRRYDGNEHRRRKELDDTQNFTPGMYDDGRMSNQSRSRRSSYSTHSSFFSSDARTTDREPRVRRRRGDFYRPAKRSESGRVSRDRSASPGQGLEKRSLRRRTPPRANQSYNSKPAPATNSGKELFPANAVSSQNQKPNGRELFPNKISASTLKKELFPNKAIVINHRRSDAFDAADETTDLFASGLTISDAAIVSKRNPFALKFATSASKDGRLENPESELGSPTSEAEVKDELSIRGISKLQDLGISIRGAAGNWPGVGKFGNAGKELFTEKLQGRGGIRNKAQDMFY